MNSQGEIVTDDSDMVELLNDYFVSVFTQENEDRPVMTNNMQDGADKLLDIVVTEEAIIKKIDSIPEDKAAGPDEMVPRILKKVSHEIGKPLYLMFRKSIDESVVPLDWRSANVSPVFKKKGNRQHPENYRPVSLTSVVGKVLESIMRDQMTQYFEVNKLIAESQHGFRRGRSYATNLLVFIEFITECIDKQENVDVVFLDFSKAFEKVPPYHMVELWTK